MTFSPDLEARFTELLRRYPPGYQRGALIPMLLYAQDEIGHLTDELIAEIARRLSLTPLQVEEVVSYYTMLRRKPAGRHHIQICTNISCMLRGGYAVLRAFEQQLGLKVGQSNADFTLVEEECIAACANAPAIVCGTEYFLDVTPERVPSIVSALKQKPHPEGEVV